MNSVFRKWSLCMAAGAAFAALAGCGGSDDNNGGGGSPPPVVNAARPTVKIVSSDPAMVSGTTTLVDVQVADATTPIQATLNGANVTSSFKADAAHAGHFLGVVPGVVTGANVLLVAQNSSPTEVDFTAYPITGPIVSGPHQTPFVCQTSTFLLPDNTTFGPALDADCSAAPKVTYMYLQTNGTALVPMPSTTTRPADVATTTTTSGVTVPYIVRVETSTVDRGILQTAVLHDPTVEATPTPTAPPKGWNRRLLAVEGYGCPGGWYIQGGVEGNLAIAGFDFSLLNVKRLGEGYATFANTLAHASNDCNAVLESEADMMSKEAFIKTYGVPDFTVSAGCSGGSYGSSQPADRIPGLFDGILISCTFPDPLGIAFSGSDGHLLTSLLGGHEPDRVHRRAEARGLGLQGHPGVPRRGEPVRTDRPGAESGRRRGLRVGDVEPGRAGRRPLRPGVEQDRRATRRCTTPTRTCTASTRRPASRCVRSTTSACSTGSMRSTTARSRRRSSST